ncbi:MAG: hypothetical protein M0023_14610 [Desulfobacteraceae bacterium]|nr:hypothetical protein [Desulfobacteraceae bacterium]
MVLDFGDLPIFEEATTYPSIVLAEKLSPIPSSASRKQKTAPAPVEQNGQFLTATFSNTKQLASLADTIANIGFSMPISNLRSEGWALERPEVLSLMDKLRTVGKPLGEYVEGRFYYGIKTGLNEAFVIDEETKARLIAEDPKSANIFKPWLRGRDIRKWRAQWAGQYLIAIDSSSNKIWPWSFEENEATARPLFEREYPAVHRYMSQWEEKLRKRDDQGRFWWELRSCVYWDEFEKTKIVYQEIATFQSFCYADVGLICNNKCFLIPEKNDFFLGLLNSKLLWWYLGNLTSGLVGGARAMQMPYMEQLPIPDASITQQTPIIELVQKILADPGNPDVQRIEAEVDRLIYDLYELTDEERSLVINVKK